LTNIPDCWQHSEWSTFEWAQSNALPSWLAGHWVPSRATSNYYAQIKQIHLGKWQITFSCVKVSKLQNCWHVWGKFWRRQHNSSLAFGLNREEEFGGGNSDSWPPMGPDDIADWEWGNWMGR
jgi:hypothetical protein